MKITFEQPFNNEAERSFATEIERLCQHVKTDDCRILAPTIRTICKPLGVDMMIGCGGSHVWIHRASEFVAGDNANPQNIRWAIITDN